jgi:hypothetical protein
MRYVAIKCDVWNTPQLRATRDGKKFFFHPNYPSHTTLTEVETLKEYDPKEMSFYEAEIEFYKDFPLEPEMVFSDGWLSPTGKFFPCGPLEHETLAYPLCLQFYANGGGGKELEQRGWAKVGIYNVLWRDGDNKATFEQILALKALAELADNDLFKRQVADVIEEWRKWFNE